MAEGFFLLAQAGWVLVQFSLRGVHHLLRILLYPGDPEPSGDLQEYPGERRLHPGHPERKDGRVPHEGAQPHHPAGIAVSWPHRAYSDRGAASLQFSEPDGVSAGRYFPAHSGRCRSRYHGTGRSAPQDAPSRWSRAKRPYQVEEPIEIFAQMVFNCVFANRGNP